MITILDLAREEAKELAADSVAVRREMADETLVEEYFLKLRFNHLYRRYMMNTVGRRITNMECNIALQQAKKDQTDGT